MTSKDLPSRKGSDISLQNILEAQSKSLDTRLQVVATLVVERLKIRTENLHSILEEDLHIGSRLANHARALPDLEAALLEKRSLLQRERRTQETECWRDLVGVIRDLLSAWEAFSQANTKQQILNSIPTGKKPVGTYHDDRKTNYNHQLR